MGGLFPFLTLAEWEIERGTWNWERVHSWENVHREVKSSSVESQLLKLLLRGPYFIKENFESRCDMLQFMQTNCEFPEHLPCHSSLENQGSPCFFPLRPPEEDRKKHPEYDSFFGGGGGRGKIIRVFVIAAFFRGNFKQKMFYNVICSSQELGTLCPLFESTIRGDKIPFACTMIHQATSTLVTKT